MFDGTKQILELEIINGKLIWSIKDRKQDD